MRENPSTAPNTRGSGCVSKPDKQPPILPGAAAGNLSLDDARALCEAGYMPLSEYLDFRSAAAPQTRLTLASGYDCARAAAVRPAAVRLGAGGRPLPMCNE